MLATLLILSAYSVFAQNEITIRPPTPEQQWEWYKQDTESAFTVLKKYTPETYRRALQNRVDNISHYENQDIKDILKNLPHHYHNNIYCGGSHEDSPKKAFDYMETALKFAEQFHFSDAALSSYSSYVLIQNTKGQEYIKARAGALEAYNIALSHIPDKTKARELDVALKQMSVAINAKFGLSDRYESGYTEKEQEQRYLQKWHTGLGGYEVCRHITDEYDHIILNQNYQELQPFEGHMVTISGLISPNLQLGNNLSFIFVRNLNKQKYSGRTPPKFSEVFFEKEGD